MAEEGEIEKESKKSLRERLRDWKESRDTKKEEKLDRKERKAELKERKAELKERKKEANKILRQTGTVRTAGRAVVAGGKGFYEGVSKVSHGSAIWIVWIILMYLSDWFTKFGGLDFLEVYNVIMRHGPIDLIRILFSPTAAIILIFYFLFMKPSDKREAGTFVFLFFLFLLFLLLGGIQVAPHMLFIIVLYLFYVYPTYEDKTQANFIVAALMAFDFLGYGMIKYFAPTLMIANRLIIPVWAYFILFKEKDKSRLAAFLLVVLLIINIFAVTDGVYGWNSYQTAVKDLGEGEILEAKSFIKTGWDNMLAFPSNIQKAWQRQIAYATGDFYTGKVEENEQEQLGVYITDIKPSERVFDNNIENTVWAKIKGRTLDDSIHIKINCSSAHKSGEMVPGIPNPTGISIYNLEEEDIDCKLPPGIKSGKVEFNAIFNFETMAYLKAYFMDYERLKNMRRQDIDPLQHYKIKDKKPIAIYTNGPVRIGMGTKEPPIGVGIEATKPKIGITLDTNPGWKGYIKKIKEVVIIVPEGTSIDSKNCNVKFKEYNMGDCTKSCNELSYAPCVKSCDTIYGGDDDYKKDCIKTCDEIKTNCEKNCKNEIEGQKAYQVDINEAPEGALTNIEDYKTFSCRLNIDDKEILLGGAPISTRYFKAKTRYDFVVEGHGSIRVKDVYEKKDIPRTTAGKVSAVKRDVGEKIKEHAQKNNLEECFVIAIITTSSGGNPIHVSENGARGLMGVKPDTAENMGKDEYDLFKEEDNIEIGTEHLGELYKKHKEKELATAEYHIGEKIIEEKCGDTYKSCKDLPTNTISFVALVMEAERICTKEEVVELEGFGAEGILEEIKPAKGVKAKDKIEFGKHVLEILRVTDDTVNYALYFKDKQVSSWAVLINEEDKEKFYKDRSFSFVMLRVDKIQDSADEEEKITDISIKYLDEFVVKNIKLVGKRKAASVEVVEDWLYVEYNGNNLGFYDNGDKLLCAIRQPHLSYIQRECERLPIKIQTKTYEKEDDTNIITIDVQYKP